MGIKSGSVLVNVITFGKTLAIAALIAGAFLFTRRSGIDFEVLVPPGVHGFGLVSRHRSWILLEASPLTAVMMEGFHAADLRKIERQRRGFDEREGDQIG